MPLRTAPCMLLLATLCALELAPGHSFYLPGVAVRDLSQGELLTIKVNKLSSTKTQVPYSYYALPYCRPKQRTSRPENFGEILRGDKIMTSPYQVKMRVNETCKVLCRIERLSARQAHAFRSKIDDDYRVYMILDNLPVALPKPVFSQGGVITVYERGFPVGFKVTTDGSEQYMLHNHLTFKILYHMGKMGRARIVGFEVEPLSIRHEHGPWNADAPVLSTCNVRQGINVAGTMPKQHIGRKEEIIFTYNVVFEESPILWSNRWETYLKLTDDKSHSVHWFSIVNSLMIVFFLSGIVAMIMLRTLRRDILAYNEHLLSPEEVVEQTGWKLVHGDVFRPPANASLLATYIGTGVQLFGMGMTTMIFAALGFLSPANRGALTTAMLLLFVSMGLFAGYYSAKFYKAFKGTHKKQTTLRTALMFPGAVFGVFFILNLLLWSEQSSGAVPFWVLFALVFLWCGVSVPLVYVGSCLGNRQPTPVYPVRTNKIPRQIPVQPWYMHSVFSCLIGGLLPFAAVFIELLFILTSIWLHQFYYLFGFLFLVFVILVITCAEISIVLCYFQLCGEEYHWWWRSYFTAGSSAFYLFLYSAYYYYTKLDISSGIPTVIYFGYTALGSYAFFCLTGTIGFCACYWFVRAIYSAVKFD